MKRFSLAAALAAAAILFSQLSLGQHAGHETMHDNMDEMPHTHLLITHEVEDGEHWLAAWRGDNSRHELFKANGANMVHTFQSADDPNLTGLVVSVNDMDKLMALLESDEGRAAAKADGVKADTMVILVETK